MTTTTKLERRGKQWYTVTYEDGREIAALPFSGDGASPDSRQERWSIEFAQTPFPQTMLWVNLTTKMTRQPPVHSFIRLVNPDGIAEREIHAGPQRMKGSTPEPPKRDSFIPLIADSLGLTTGRNVWFRLMTACRTTELSTDNNEISATVRLIEGGEADILAHWNAALAIATHTNEGNFRYNLYRHNCNTMATTLCYAMQTGMEGIPRKWQGFHVAPELVSPDLRMTFNRNVKPDIAELRQQKIVLEQRICCPQAPGIR